MSQATNVVKRRFDLTADWRYTCAPGWQSKPILDELGADLLDETGAVLYDEVYYAGTGEARDLLVYRRVFDLSADARD